MDHPAASAEIPPHEATNQASFGSRSLQQTACGRVYLAVAMDLFSRKVVGWPRSIPLGVLRFFGVKEKR
ncbi:MAG: hypothetical protein QGF59_26930 [Pirellulaceae bacterium]|nr:hypothetical protein [Pirellulaceae bacterium]